jgi:hypothetical protein
MIIMVRGNHGSGKSTAVRNAMKLFGTCTPLYGDLGPKAPEAYCCLRAISLKHVAGPPTFVLGPYGSSATCGFDYITKLGVKAATLLLEKYQKKGNIVFESIMTSARILEPSIGRFIKVNKDEVLIATLDTTYEECLRSVEERKRNSIAGNRWNSTHLAAQQHMIERVTGQYAEMGYRMEYVSRANAPEKILEWSKEKR